MKAKYDLYHTHLYHNFDLELPQTLAISSAPLSKTESCLPCLMLLSPSLLARTPIIASHFRFHMCVQDDRCLLHTAISKIN